MKTPGLILVAMGLALLAPVAFGATRTSANYSLTTETGDAGGLRASSASYVSDGSIGGLGGLGSVVVPPEIFPLRASADKIICMLMKRATE